MWMVSNEISIFRKDLALRTRNSAQHAHFPLPGPGSMTKRTESAKTRHLATGVLAMVMAAAQVMPTSAAITNSVTATGTAPGGATVTGSGTATVTVQTAAPAVTIVKTAILVDGGTGVAGKGDAGETINYTYKVKNAGNVTLTNVSINDVSDGLNPSGLVFAAPVVSSDAAPSGDSTNANAAKTKWDTLAPGDEVTFASSYVIAQADINAAGGGTTQGAHVEPDNKLDNTVTVTADYNNPATSTTTTVTASDHQAVPLNVAPGLTVAKTADKTSNLKAGDVVTYTYTITNSGNADITDITLADTFKGVLNGLSPGPAFQSFTTDPGGHSTHAGNTITLLKAGSVAVYTASYTVTQADVDAQ
jgi:uncharacterized repeat protein (TIGR01451 family)